jgi:CubicO group peptidase (beta-lactamase class C family)
VKVNAQPGRAGALAESSPAEQGVDARRIAAFLDAVEAEPGAEPHSLMILRHGKLVAQGWWAPFAPDRKHLLYSLSKSFTGAAAAVAYGEGRLDLDEPVLSYFPEFEAEITDPRSRRILVRHVLAMASGHGEEQWEAAVDRDPAEPVRGFLLNGPDHEPGSVFAYNQPCTYSVAAIVQRVAGERLVDYLRPRLFEPLGIGEVAWEQHPAGRDVGFTGLHATTDAIAKLGQLYLQRGVWDGVRLLPEDWVEQATRAQVANGGPEAGPDWSQGYGFQFWMSLHGFRGDGAYGQYCLILPEQDAVVVMTSETLDMQRMLDMVWKHLLPAFDGAAADAGTARQADASLARRLRELAVPPCAGAAPTGQEAAERIPADGLELSAGDDEPIALLRLEQDPDEAGGLGGLRLVVTENAVQDEPFEAGYEGFPQGTFTLRLRPGGGWSVSAPDEIPTAVSGGWVDADTLRFDVLFLETPHCLQVTCDLARRTVESHYRHPPLRVSALSRVRAPQASH